MNTKQVTLFSLQQFTEQADRIDDRAEWSWPKRELVMEEIRRQTKSREGEHFPLRERPNVLQTEFLIDPMRIQSVKLAPDLPIRKNPSTELVRSTSRVRLEYGEWIPTPPVFQDGWLICLPDGWVYVDRPPRVILPREPFWLQ